MLLASCASSPFDKNDKLREALQSTWIYVEDDMIRPETASQFFPKLNARIREASPEKHIEIYVASEILPQMVTNSTPSTLDPFSEPQKEPRENSVPVISWGRAMPLGDLLKLFCDVTGTRYVIENNKILIAPVTDNKTPTRESNQSVLGTR